MVPTSFLRPAASITVGIVLAAAPAIAQTPDSQRGDSFHVKLQSAPVEQTQFHLPPGFEIQLVASEPGIRKPLNLTFDAQGRCWVTGTDMYPWPAKTDARGDPIAAFEKNWDDNAIAFRAAARPPVPKEQATDAVYVLGDFAPDGRPRSVSMFADGLNIPIGLLPLPRKPGKKGDTLIVYSIPAIWRLEDTDGDGKADVRERLYGDFGFKDTHGMSSNYTYWVDGWVYGTHGFANLSTVRDASGAVTTLFSGNTYRFRPDGSRFEVWANGQTNPFGLAFDPRGDVYTADSHSKPVYLLLAGGFYEGINKTHDGLGFAPAITQDNHGSSAIAGIATYAASQFPEEYHGNLFNGNPVTRRINRDRLDWTGSSPKAVRQEDFLWSDDPSFRPIQVKLGPDGALWIADFYNPIIGHYESPLTHPDRDRAHGRIWRIVWRGLNNEVPSPAVPVLPSDMVGLARSLFDENLVVRTLATNELVDRFGAAAVPVLHGLKTKLAAPAAADSVFPVLAALERLGAPDDDWLSELLTNPKTPIDASTAAIRILGERSSLGRFDEAFFSALVGRTAPGHLWRQLASLFTRHPGNWQAGLVMKMRAATTDNDPQLIYALRLALKTQAAEASLAELKRWQVNGPADAGATIADVLVAVRTPAASEFLLGYLQATSFAGSRAGEFVRHAVTQLPPGDFAVVESLIRTLSTSGLESRLALAEGLATVARLPGRTLPPSVQAWTESTLLLAIADENGVLVRRGILATKDLPMPAKYPVLDAIGKDPDRAVALRDAVARNVGASADGVPVLLGIVNSKGSVYLRKTAVDQLGFADQATLEKVAPQMASILSTAPSDLALALAIVMAKTNPGAEALIQAVTSGHVPAVLLRHRYVASALEKRSAALRARAEDLTRNLPSEDARIDAIIAQRLTGYSSAKPEAKKGEAIFTQQCAVCHRLRGTGGNIGPNLDGVGARDLTRLVEDILDPNRNVDPVFKLTTVTLKDGQTITGMNKREEGPSVFLTDPGTGHEQTIATSSVVNLAASAFSPMPAVFESAIPESDFYDLIAFLLSPTAP